MTTNRVYDKRRRGWFWIDNAIIDHCGLGVYELAVYMVLARYADADGMAFPSLATLADKIGASKPTIIKALKALEAKGLIAIEPRYDGKQHKSNVYTLLDPPQANPAVVIGGRADNSAMYSDHNGHDEGAVSVDHNAQADNNDNNGGGSKPGLPGVVNEVYQGSKRGLPEENLSKKTQEEENIINHHHVPYVPGADISGADDDDYAELYRFYEQSIGRVITPHDVTRVNQLKPRPDKLKAAIQRTADEIMAGKHIVSPMSYALAICQNQSLNQSLNNRRQPNGQQEQPSLIGLTPDPRERQYDGPPIDLSKYPRAGDILSDV